MYEENRVPRNKPIMISDLQQGCQDYTWERIGSYLCVPCTGLAHHVTRLKSVTILLQLINGNKLLILFFDT